MGWSEQRAQEAGKQCREYAAKPRGELQRARCCRVRAALSAYVGDVRLEMLAEQSAIGAKGGSPIILPHFCPHVAREQLACERLDLAIARRGDA